MSGAIDGYRLRLDQVSSKIYNEKDENFVKICSITDDFLKTH